MGRWSYVVAMIAVGALLAGCGGQSGSEPADPGTLQAITGDPGQAGPVALIGAWTLADVDDEDAGTILRLAPDEVQVFGSRCGMLSGSWRADLDGLFVAGIFSSSGAEGIAGCETASESTPGWLRRVTAYRLEGHVPVLLDDRGRPVARLLPGAKPTAGPNLAASEVEQPVVTDEVRRSFAPAVELPATLTPAGRDKLVGRWVPVRGPKTAYVELAEDGEWRGSDGCNGHGGRWVAGSAGALLATAGPSTLIACDSVPVGTWLWTARRVGFDSEVLVFFDAQAKETGRMRPAA
jgi:antitoxin (DNA-binding transcriptional repressor) of toxin-antitoxin stability system